MTIKAVVNAYGFAGVEPKVKVFFDGKEVAAERAKLAKERDNEVTITVKAPAEPGEVRVRFEVEVLPGEVSDLNNAIETYLTVTKEGLRVLVVDTLRLGGVAAARRPRPGHDGRGRQGGGEAAVRPGRSDPPDRPAADARGALYLDLDQQAYDVMVIGNLTARQLTSVRPDLLEKIAERVRKKGMGLILLGGERAFGGAADAPGTGDWRGTPVEGVLPVTFDAGGIVEAAQGRPGFQTVPTANGLNQYLMRLDADPGQNRQLWDQLNTWGRDNRSRLTGYNRLQSRPTATVYAWTTDAPAVVDPAKVGNPQRGDGDPLLVGHQIGDGSRGRVLAFAGFDTYLWERLGQPKTRQGVEIHRRFWRQVVRWLAHQEEDEGLVYARPEFRRLAVGGKQSIRVGVRGPDGADLKDAEYDVRVVAPGETEAAAKPRPVVADPAGGARLPYEPAAPGEYVVVVTGRRPATRRGRR